MPPKKEWTIPLRQAVPILVVGMSMIAFVLSEQAERREMRNELDTSAQDRFRGADMDLFIERLQVALDAHTRVDGKPVIVLPTWRH